MSLAEAIEKLERITETALSDIETETADFMLTPEEIDALSRYAPDVEDAEKILQSYTPITDIDLRSEMFVKGMAVLLNHVDEIRDAIASGYSAMEDEYGNVD